MKQDGAPNARGYFQPINEAQWTLVYYRGVRLQICKAISDDRYEELCDAVDAHLDGRAARKLVAEQERLRLKRDRLRMSADAINRWTRLSLRSILSARRQQKVTVVEQRLGYGREALRAHLESLFALGMSWDNRGAWHIDHIRPLSSFKITSFACQDFKRAWALCNLQPLWATDNLRKGAKWSEAA
jgi:hypothetical protein